MAGMSSVVAGRYPNSALKNELEQSAIISTGISLTFHRATPRYAGYPNYPIGDNLGEASRTEPGDIVFGYQINEDSTTDGDPNVVFRHLNGMNSAIRVVARGVLAVDFSPTMTSSEQRNATQEVSFWVGGQTTACYTGDVVANKYSPIFLKQDDAEHARLVQIPRMNAKRANYGIICPMMYPADQLRTPGNSIGTRVANRLREQINELLSGDDDNQEVTTGRLRDTAERTGIPATSGLRRVLLNAGIAMLPHDDRDMDAGPELPYAEGDRVPLGDNLIVEFDAICQDILRESRQLDDPCTSLDQLFCIYMYLTSLASVEGAFERTARPYWALNGYLVATLIQYAIYLVEDEVYNREYMYFGRILDYATPRQRNCRFQLA